MSQPGIKLAFSNREQRVRVEFAVGSVRDNAPVPTDLIARAQARLEQEKTARQIADFMLYPERLHAAWEAARAHKGPSDLAIILTLGQGFPKKDALALYGSKDPKIAFHITLKGAAEEWRKWLPEMLEAAVQKEAVAKNITRPFHRAQLHHALVHVQNFQMVDKLAILCAPEKDVDQKGYRLVANRGRREAFMVISSGELLAQADVEDRLLRSAQDAVAKLSDEAGSYLLRKADIVRELRRARSGPERLGVDLPLVVLMATAAPERARGSALSEADVPDEAPRSATHRALLPIKITDQALQAVIEQLEPGFYEAHGELKPTPEWIKAELKDKGVRFGIEEKAVASLVASLTKKEAVRDMVLAVAKEAKPASEPYLHPAFRDSKTKDMTGIINLRDFQSMELVHKGELIAEVRYKRKAEVGKDVLGRDIPPPPGESFSLTVGEGVESRDDGMKLYATVDGMPQMSDRSILVSETYVHKGDVNLKSGNIYFEGSVVVEGGIEHGATVIVGGNLLVKGTIGPAIVKAKGNIEATQGIVTTDKGRVQANGSVRALFIDNSTVVCGRDVFAQKSVTNSQIIAGGAIDVTAEGVIAGGELSCKDIIKTGRLGFPQGAKTVCHVGIDWRVELKVRIVARRMAALSARETQDRLALRELTRKAAAQMTAKHKEMQKTIQDRLARIRKLTTRLEARIVTAKSGLTWEKEAKIYVHANLATNVDLEVGGIKMAVKQELLGVILSTKKYKDGYISPIEDVIGKEKDERAS